MNFLLLMLCIILGNTLAIQLSVNNNAKHCFKYTWPGSLKTGEGEGEDQVNCTVLESMKLPCVDPVIYNITAVPNPNDIWEDKDKDRYLCLLQRGNSCIRYTYSFDDAIINATYFCGKMIQNKETAINNGCFTQKVGGYSVEACACQSTGYGNGLPCYNSLAKMNYYSAVLVLVLLFLSL